MMQSPHAELQNQLSEPGLRHPGEGERDAWGGPGRASAAARGCVPLWLQPSRGGGKGETGDTGITWEVMPIKCSCCSLK